MESYTKVSTAELTALRTFHKLATSSFKGILDEYYRGPNYSLKFFIRYALVCSYNKHMIKGLPAELDTCISHVYNASCTTLLVSGNKPTVSLDELELNISQLESKPGDGQLDDFYRGIAAGIDTVRDYGDCTEFIKPTLSTLKYVDFLGCLSQLEDYTLRVHDEALIPERGRLYLLGYLAVLVEYQNAERNDVLND